MQNIEGRVVSTLVDDSGIRAVVEVASAVVCARCESGKGCGAGLLGRQSGARRIEADVIANLDVKNGDLVSVALAPRNILRAAVIAYGYPLAGTVLATVFAFAADLGDVYGAIAALTGLIVGIAVAKYRLGNSKCLRDFTPTVIERAPLMPN